MSEDLRAKFLNQGGKVLNGNLNSAPLGNVNPTKSADDNSNKTSERLRKSIQSDAPRESRIIDGKISDESVVKAKEKSLLPVLIAFVMASIFCYYGFQYFISILKSSGHTSEQSVGTTIQEPESPALKVQDSVVNAPSVAVVVEQPKSTENNVVTSKSDIEASPQQKFDDRSASTVKISEQIAKYRVTLLEQKDCGDFSELFCKSDVVKRAVSSAYDKSLACEMGVEAGTECKDSARAFISAETKKFEVNALIEARKKTEYNLEHPNRLNNYSSRDFAVEKKCSEETELRAPPPSEKLNVYSACISAEKDARYLVPLRKLLVKIDARLNEIGDLMPASK